MTDGAHVSLADAARAVIAIRSADDELATVLEEILAEHGFAALALPADPREAMAMLATRRPAAIVVEISRPGPRGGSDLIAQLQGAGDLGDIPVLVCGSDMTVVERLAGMHGASPTFAALEMPFRMDDLLRLLRELTSEPAGAAAGHRPAAASMPSAPADIHPR